MAGRFRIGAAAAALIVSLVPVIALANNLNVNTGPHIPIRPHVNLNSTIHLDVKARTFNDVDLSDGCRMEDDRLKTSKRKRPCRLDR
ncbi:MAG TPA: hypothetical protein VF499_07120 [Afipia sp.]